MQVNKINSNNQAFGAKIRVRPEDIDHVMSTLDSRCDNAGLRRIYNTLKSGEKGKGSKDIVYIEDYSNTKLKQRPKECGFLKAKIDGWNYTNDVIPTFSFWSLPHYFEKIQRLSKEKYTNSLSNSGNRFDELCIQNDIMLDKLLGTNKASSSKPSKHRDNLLDAIYSILTKKQ